MFPDRARWAPQGRRRRKSVVSGRGGSGSISGRVMAPCDLRGILTAHLRSPLKMQRFEPSIDLDFANGLFQKGSQLNNYFLSTFQPSLTRPRDTVEMQGFELVAILVATSDLQHFLPGALASTQGALWTSCRAAESLGNGAPSARQIVCIFAMDSE